MERALQAVDSHHAAHISRLEVWYDLCNSNFFERREFSTKSTDVEF